MIHFLDETPVPCPADRGHDVATWDYLDRQRVEYAIAYNKMMRGEGPDDLVRLLQSRVSG